MRLGIKHFLGLRKITQGPGTQNLARPSQILPRLSNEKILSVRSFSDFKIADSGLWASLHKLP